jgi:hypothetical protein
MKENKTNDDFTNVDTVLAVGLLSIEKIRCNRNKLKTSLLDELVEANTEITKNIDRERDTKVSRDNSVGSHGF